MLKEKKPANVCTPAGKEKKRHSNVQELNNDHHNIIKEAKEQDRDVTPTIYWGEICKELEQFLDPFLKKHNMCIYDIKFWGKYMKYNYKVVEYGHIKVE
jgi:hypothetical protein